MLIKCYHFGITRDNVIDFLQKIDFYHTNVVITCSKINNNNYLRLTLGFFKYERLKKFDYKYSKLFYQKNIVLLQFYDNNSDLNFNASKFKFNTIYCKIKVPKPSTKHTTFLFHKVLHLSIK